MCEDGYARVELESRFFAGFCTRFLSYYREEEEQHIVGGFLLFALGIWSGFG